MNILVVGLVKNIQLKRLQEEGEKLGHNLQGCYSKDLTILTDQTQFEPRLKGKDLNAFDLIYSMVSKRRWEWYAACHYLHKTKGTIIVNQKIVDPGGSIYLTPAADYLNQFEQNLPFPKSEILYSLKNVDQIAQEFKFPLILKTTRGRKGIGVYLVNSKEGLSKIKTELPKNRAYVLREFVPNDGDIRILTVGYKVVGAMKRIPQKGEFRSNISRGGTGVPFDLESYPKMRELAEKASEITRTEIAGVDIILHQETGQPYILEINPSPQFEGIEKYTSANIALEIVKYFEKLHNKL